MSNPLINPTRVILPVKQAIAKTTHWRNFMARTFTDLDVKALPKAVYISRNDIIEMAQSLQADESLLGARAYFTLDKAYEEGVTNQIKFLMVLVKDTPGYFNGQDMLYIGPEGKAASEGVGDIDDSGVYDYTRPCPDTCDKESPLFGG